MMDHALPPRSVLHSINPIGLGSPDVESLTSYFSRLARSHGMSSSQLARWVLEKHGQAVPEDFRWNQRNFVSMDPETERWTAWLSELTAVGNLDHLTLMPWHDRLGVPGLTPKLDRWCPCCLADDLAAGRVPYLHLAWDLAPVTVCLVHKVELAHECPHCQRSNIRNRASIVVPGYCTSCGGFLGKGPSDPATPEALWVARQIGKMLANPPLAATRAETTETLRAIVERMSGGNVAAFAKRVGMSKSSIWHLLNKGGLPTIRTWLDISLQGGIGMDKLLCGDIEGWSPPATPPQLLLDLHFGEKPAKHARVLDWEEIKLKARSILEAGTPITVAEACTQLGVDPKHLYLRANAEARAIAARYRDFEADNNQRRQQELKETLASILADRREQGLDGLSARDIRERIAGTDLGNVRNLFGLIRNVRDGVG